MSAIAIWLCNRATSTGPHRSSATIAAKYSTLVFAPMEVQMDYESVSKYMAVDNKPIDRRSRIFLEGFEHPAARGQLAGAGLTREHYGKAQVAIVHNGFDQNTCNMHLDEFALIVQTAVNSSQKLKGWKFPVGGISDGIVMGLPGMRASLLSREWIADAVEGHVYAHPYDAMVAIPGCDKNMPGVVMAMARLNIPSIMVYGGTIEGGCYRGEKTNIVTGFEGKGRLFQGTIAPEELEELIMGSGREGESGICPGAGACGGMYTANTMASAIEALGVSLPYSSSAPTLSQDKRNELEGLSGVVENLVASQILPRDILTREAFENAITLVNALGGSTNAVLHLIAIARAADVDLTVDDFQRIGDRTPYLADMKPSGRYLMEDLHAVGGTPAVLKLLLSHGLLHGDCITVTGKTLAENLATLPELADGQDVIKPFDQPTSRTGHLKILYGNLAPTSAVAKITGKEGSHFEGPAHVFDSESEAIQALKDGNIHKGEVIVIRYEGPRGAPGMPEMLDFTSAVVGAGLANDLALMTDGRFSGGSHGFVIGHVTPEAYVGGPIALVRNGDRISIDATERTINVQLDRETLELRRREWKAPALKYDRGLFFKATRDLAQANLGAVSDMAR
jgi:dihydroxy-acid dehydratase